jgi:hypothetical protein
VLGPDGKLLPAERMRRLREGLCLLCGRRGHSVKDCPRAKNNNSGPSSGPNVTRARAVKAEPVAGPSQPKN